MLRRTSLKDIAGKVGVSTALVSYVLNNKKEGRISKEVAEKIREMAAKLNYRPNQIAKSLKTNKTYTIGLIVADISNPFSSGLARVIEDEAEKQGYTVIYCSSDENSQKSARLIDALVNRQADGLIILPPADASDQILGLHDEGIPFVLVDRYFPDIETNWVSLDNYSSTFEAVKHLVGEGYKTIGMVTYKAPQFNLQERKRGYLEGLKINGIDFHRDWLREVDVHNDQKGIENAIQELLSLDKPIDAVLFGNNHVSICGLKFIHGLPVKVPQELAIVAFDETELFDFFYAPLTYIKQPLQQMGLMAISILLDNINNGKTSKQVTMSAELVIRKSTVM
jgi:LacI family transcriptional regulator, galactose operon repressor